MLECGEVWILFNLIRESFIRGFCGDHCMLQKLDYINVVLKKKSFILNYGGFRCKCILFHKIFDGVDCVRSKTLLNQSITLFGDMGNPL